MLAHRGELLQFYKGQKSIPSFLHSKAKMQAMTYLSGIAVESIFPSGSLPWPDWFDSAVLDCQRSRGGKYRHGHDCCKAANIAEAICGENRAWTMLSTLARWTGQMIAEPRVRKVVEVLAHRLMTVKTRLDGSIAMGIMDEAWGEPTIGLLHMQLGPKWRRRLPINKSPAPDEYEVCHGQPEES